MKSLQEYRTIYREIAQNLGYRGDSVELLVHLLANATYLEEVENISFALESSLEKAHLDNSKIQHCMDLMYSVYRGSCPRVYMKIKPSRIKTLTKYSEIATSSNFNVYFLAGALASDIEDIKDAHGFDYGLDGDSFSFNIAPGREYILSGFISKSPVTKTSVIDYTNQYYLDLDDENLSNDMLVQVNKHGQGSDIKVYKTTSDFKEYLLMASEESYVFDLTTTDYGSRLYFKDSPDIEPSDEIITTYFPYTTVSSFLLTELGKITINFGELCEFSDIYKKRVSGGESESEIEYSGKGLIILRESERESLSNIHYEANKSRYQNSIVRSNEDLGDLLRRRFNEIVKEAGCKFEDDYVIIYYIPFPGKRLTDSDRRKFIDSYLAYYVSRNINIILAPSRTLNLDISLVLSSAKSSDELREDIENNILSKYSDNFDAAKNIITRPAEVLNQISSAISRISSVDYVKDIKFDESVIQDVIDGDYDFVYFSLNCNVNTSLS